jgi:hypothetical protein
VIYPALLFLFAIDSIVTYVGIHSGNMGEYNPVVRHMIEGYGLGAAMILIFFYKSILLLSTAKWRKHRAIVTAWRGLFAFYGGALVWSWVVYLNQ